jgi:hypothetical protein
VAAFIVSGATCIFALLSIFGDCDLASPWNLADAALAAFLGVMIRRMSRAAAVAMLVLFVAGRVSMGIGQGLSAGIGVR